MSSLGLKITQYSLLTHVEKLAPVSQARIADEMGMDASTLSRNLRPLIAAGWIAVDAGDDARSHTLSLTVSGLAKRNEAKRAWKKAQLQLNAIAGENEVAKLHALIDRMTIAIVERGV
jgi:DNA-binding MarR family transcriptional regulator